MDIKKIRAEILNGSIYKKPRYKAWRKKVYIRDDYTCRMCGKKDVYLNAHHIRPKYKNPQLIYSVDNGITLCVPCHKQVTGCEQDYVRFFNELVRKTKQVKKNKSLLIEKPKKKKKKRSSQRKRLIRRIFK